MRRFGPTRWPLRVRVTLAFLAATTVALAALGTFVLLRMEATFEERLHETVGAEADRLVAMSVQDRDTSVRALGGDPFAQTLTSSGQVSASSALVAGDLVGNDLSSGYRDVEVALLDDDAAARGVREVEREVSVLLVRRTGDGYVVVGTSREDTDDALAEVRKQLVVGGALALLLAGALGYVVAGAGLRPIERLRARAATISGRSAGERLPVPPAEDELRRLAVTLNEMLDRLDEGAERERRFLAEASHELRTPLALMLTETELALERPRSPEELTSALRSVEDEVRRLVVLAHDLLDRMASGQRGLPIDVHPVDLVALARQVVDRFRVAAGDRRLTVRAGAPVVVDGDAAHLDRALSNLVDNAIRHGAGDVEVEVRSTGDRAFLVVGDEGKGFGAGATAPAGLGLTIVEEIVAAHGGRLEVGRADGEHTRVRVTL